MERFIKGFEGSRYYRLGLLGMVIGLGLAGAEDFGAELPTALVAVKVVAFVVFMAVMVREFVAFFRKTGPYKPAAP